MLYKLLNPLSLRGTRFERDAVVELNDDEVKAIDPTDIEVASDAEVAATEETAPVETGEVAAPVDEKPRTARKGK